MALDPTFVFYLLDFNKRADQVQKLTGIRPKNDKELEKMEAAINAKLKMLERKPLNS